MYRFFVFEHQRICHSLYYLSTEIELTAEMEYNLSQCITSESELRHFGVHGLNVKQHVIDSALRDSNGSVNEAAFLLIRAWSDSFTSKEQAYKELSVILWKINKLGWINELIAD